MIMAYVRGAVSRPWLRVGRCPGWAGRGAGSAGEGPAGPGEGPAGPGEGPAGPGEGPAGAEPLLGARGLAEQGESVYAAGVVGPHGDGCAAQVAARSEASSA